MNFIRRINARELLKNTAYGEEAITLLDDHLLYVKAFLVKQELLNSPGEEYFVYNDFFDSLSTEDRCFRILDILESIHPSICKDMLYLTNKAFAYFHNGDFVTAISLYDEAIRLRPQLIELYHCRAFLLRMIEKAAPSVLKKEFTMRESIQA